MKKRVLLSMILSACSKTQTDDKGTETGSQSQQQILVEIAEDSDDQYSKWAEAKEKHRLEMEYAYDGRPQYQEALRNGYADPQTPKLTYQDVKDIIADVAKERKYDGVASHTVSDEQDAYIETEIVNRIRAIQHYADLQMDGYNSHSCFIFWPDANTVEERRTSIEVTEYCYGGLGILYTVYDDNGEIVSEEEMYNSLGWSIITNDTAEANNIENMNILNDEDYFCYTPSQNRTYSITPAVTGSGTLGCYIYNNVGTLLGSGDSNNGCSIALTGGSQYYIRLKCTNNVEYVKYTLQIS